MVNKPITINRYRDAVKDPPPDGWVGGIMLEGFPNAGSYSDGKYWMGTWGGKVLEVVPEKWLSENELAIPKVTWVTLRMRIDALMVKAGFNEIFACGCQQVAMCAVRMYYEDVLAIMDELETQNGQ